MNKSKNKNQNYFKTIPHNYLALLIVYKALPDPLAFLSDPWEAGKDFHPHVTEEETRAPGGKHSAPGHMDVETGRSAG